MLETAGIFQRYETSATEKDKRHNFILVCCEKKNFFLG